MKLKIYEGIRKGYPRLAHYSSRLAAYGQLVRPYTLLAPALGGLAGSLIPFFYYSNSIAIVELLLSNWQKVLFLTLFFVCVQAGGQTINHVYDVEIDRLTKPYRPLVRGILSPEEAKRLGIILIVISIISSFLLGSLVLGLLGLVGTFLSVFYSAEPIRAKKRHWIISLSWQAMARGFLPFMMIWLTYVPHLELFPLLLSLSAFLWVFAFQSTKDFADVEGDKKFGIRTLPVVYGRDAISYIRRLGIIAVWSTVLLWFIRPAFALLTFVLAVIARTICWSLERNVVLEKFENNLAWLLFYLGLGLYFLLTPAILLL